MQRRQIPLSARTATSRRETPEPSRNITRVREGRGADLLVELHGARRHTGAELGEQERGADGRRSRDRAGLGMHYTAAPATRAQISPSADVCWGS